MYNVKGQFYLKLMCIRKKSFCQQIWLQQVHYWRFWKLILSQPQLNSILNITLSYSVRLDLKMSLHTRISSGCSTQTLSLGLGSFGMAELKSALLFGVTIYFEMKMGQNSPGLVWFGWYDLNLFDGEGNFSVGKYYCHNPNSTPT